MNDIEEIFGPINEGKSSDSPSPAPVSATKGGDEDNYSIPQERIEEGQNTTPMMQMASIVMKTFQDNASFRRSSGVHDKLLYALRAQTCTFSDSQREKLLTKFPAEIVDKIFVPITSTKIRAAKAMLIDLANQSGEPLFRIEATPDPDVPRHVSQEVAEDIQNNLNQIFLQLQNSGVQQLPPEAEMLLQKMVASSIDNSYDEITNKKSSYAKERAKRMERKVWDMMCEGGFTKAFMQSIDNVCTYGTSVIVGPVERIVATNKCIEDKDKKVVKYKRVFAKKLVYESINPMDCYPAPDATEVTDGAFCIRVKYTAEELYRFTKSENSTSDKKDGWIKNVVKGILARHPNGGIKIIEERYDATRRFCEKNGVEDINDCTFEGVRCFMAMRGSALLEIGVTKTREGKKIECEAYYNTETIVIDNRVVYCRVYQDELSVPISKCVFYTLPGSWWGESVADKVAMTQLTLNNIITALLSNMSASSLPVWWIKDLSRLTNKSMASMKIKAGMTIPFNQSVMSGDASPPIGAISVPSTAGELLAIWARFQTQADLDSGIPAYTEGQSAGQSGALRTASGLAVFTEASNRGMKMVMTTIDQNMISNIARMTADYILLNDDDMEIKGDVNVRSVGLVGKILKAQRDQQRMQLFDMVQKSPILSQIAGVKGLVALFRPTLQDLDINPDEVLPSVEKMKEMEELQQIKQILEATAGQGMPPPQQGGGMAQPNDMQQGLQQQGVPDIGQADGPRPGSVAERRAIA